MNHSGVVARNSAMGHRILRQLGFSRSTRYAIAGEVGNQFLRMRDFYGGTEDQDLWAVAIMAAWRTIDQRPDAGGGLIRLRVRWALREVLRQEARAHGVVRERRGTVTAADPAQWPRCPCGQPVSARQADYCPACRRARTRGQWRAANDRKKAQRAAA